MTLFYSHDGINTIIFETNDDYPHISERKPGEPFHLFRTEKKDAYPGFTPTILYRLLKLAISRYEDNEQAHITDWPDIVGNYEKAEFEGIKVSYFEVDGYFVAATILVPA